MKSLKKKDTEQEFARQVKTLVSLLFILIICFLFSFCIGRLGVPLPQVCKILFNSIIEKTGLIHISQTWTDYMEAAVLNIRLPRIILACLVGCCLSAAGAAYQGVFQNPMASPDILGASSGAAFGAALAILFGMSKTTITLYAFAMSLITVFVVIFISNKAPGMKVVNLILAGIMVGSLFSSGTSFIKLVADPTNQLPEITYWLMGSLSGAKLEEIIFPLIPMLIGLVPLYCIRWQINLLSLGEDEARALGVNTNITRLIIIIASTLVTAASISVSGMIGWVGLVIPHLCRKLVGSNYRWLMPASMLGGAIFLVMVDNVSRNITTAEIPIGILTAFIGAPFFVYLLTRKEKTL